MLEEEEVPPTLETLMVGWPLDTPPSLASAPSLPTMPHPYHLLRGTTTQPTQAHGSSG